MDSEEFLKPVTKIKEKMDVKGLIKKNVKEAGDNENEDEEKE